MRSLLLAAAAFTTIVPTAARAADTNVIDALAATADDEGRVSAVFIITAAAPLGGGLMRVDATWQGRPVSGLMEEPPAGPYFLGFRMHAQGTVVAAGGTSAFIGATAVTDGTSNTIVFCARGARFAATTATSFNFQDVMIESRAIASPDHSLFTTPSGAPFAAAVFDAPPSGETTAIIDASGAVVQTPLGPIGTMRSPQGIIAILIGL
jgi:hypothetical protein